MTISKTVQERVQNLWAVLATAAAKKAVDRVTAFNDIEGAERYAETAARWLQKAGANAARYAYQQPR